MANGHFEREADNKNQILYSSRLVITYKQISNAGTAE